MPRSFSRVSLVTGCAALGGLLLLIASPAARALDTLAANAAEMLLAAPAEVRPIGPASSPRGSLSIRTIKDRASPFYGLKLCTVTLPAASTSVRVIAPARREAKSSAFKAASRANDVVLVNGGFWALDHKGGPYPLGLVVADARRASKLVPWKTGGAVVVRDQALSLVRAGELNGLTGEEQAVQSKPFVVENGLNGIRTRDRERHDRAAVGLDTRGAIVVAGVFAPDGRAITLWEFGELLRASRKKGGLEVRDALAMDGGPGAYIYVPGLDYACGTHASNYLPSLIAFGAKRRAAS